MIRIVQKILNQLKKKNFSGTDLWVQPAAVLIKRTCSPGMNFKLSAKLVRDPGTFRLKLLQAISVDATPG